MEDRFKKISKKTKDLLLGKILLGIPINEIVKQMAAEAEKMVDKPITKEDVRRIANRNLPIPNTKNLDENLALIKLLEKPAIRAYNYRSFIPNLESHLSEDEKKRLVDTPEDRFMIFYMSDRLEDFCLSMKFDLTVVIVGKRVKTIFAPEI